MATSQLPGGTHTITAVYGGNTNLAGNTSAALDQTVNQASTSTTVINVDPPVFGQSVTITAPVNALNLGSGTPTGTVTFEDDGGSLGTGTLNGTGLASFTTSALTAAVHSLTAVYSGDTNLTRSTSLSLNQTIIQASTSTTLTTSASAAVLGQTLTFTATVTANAPGAGIATGLVTFEDGTTSIGTETLTGGSATFITTSLSVAGHAITAVYSGDTNFTGSTSLGLNQTVNQASTSTTLTTSASAAADGQTLTFTASVTAASPGAGTATGTVTFCDGTTSIGTGALASGTATLTTANLALGCHGITALYSGDTNFSLSTSNTLPQAVQQTTMTAVATSLNPSGVGQSLTFFAFVQGVMLKPTGTVTFEDGGSVLGTAILDATDNASFSGPALGLGSHAITAVYGGDSSSLGSTSSTYNQVVYNAGPTLTVAATQNPSADGSAVTFTVTVSGSPAGTVTFFDGAVILGTGAFASGTATFTTANLVLGSHAVTAILLRRYQSRH